MPIWIGTADLDRLFSYPQRHNLSSSWFPIHLLQPVLARALRTLEALPYASVSLAFDVGVLASLTYSRVDGFCPTSG